MKNNKEGREGEEGLKREGGLIRGEAYLREGGGGEGGLNRGFTVWVAQGKWILLT